MIFFASQRWCVLCVCAFLQRSRTPSSSFVVVKSSQTTERMLHTFICVTVKCTGLISFLSGVTYKVLITVDPTDAHHMHTGTGLTWVQWGWFWWSSCQVLMCDCVRFPTCMSHCRYRWRAGTWGSKLCCMGPVATCLWVCFFMCLKIKKKKKITVVWNIHDICHLNCS